MIVYQCKSCYRIVSNDLSFIEDYSSGVVVTGVADCISLVPTRDPNICYLKCVCKTIVGKCHGTREINAEQLTFKLENDCIIRYLIKKLVGQRNIDSEEHDVSDDKYMNLDAKIAKLEKELKSLKEEKHSEKMETLCGMMNDNMQTLTRLAELLCELHSDLDLKSVFEQIF